MTRPARLLTVLLWGAGALMLSAAVPPAEPAPAPDPPPAEAAPEPPSEPEPEPAPAEPAPERPSEDDLFGGDDEPAADEPARDAPAPKPGKAGREDSIFGEGADVDAGFDDSALEIDPLAIGGMAYLRLAASVVDQGNFLEQRLSMPNLVDLYLDARPEERVRAYVSGRLRFDPTIESGDTDFLGEPAEMASVLLDQLWLKTDIARTVYVTLGRQRIKWGASRIWNPTDFLNQTKRNPLSFFDERTGVGLLKIHVPIESLGWNLYAIGVLDGADKIEQLGGALRAEIVLGPAELTVSAAAGEGMKTAVGVDLSAGIWEFDVHAELAITDESGGTRWEGPFAINEASLADSTFPQARKLDAWFARVSAGLDYTFTYGDNDLMTLGAEYYFNPLGYEDDSVYPWLLANGAFEPFYIGRHYAAFFWLIPAPGAADDLTLTTSTLANLSDLSFITRLDASFALHTRLRLEAYVMVHYGQPGGELRFEFDIPEGLGAALGAEIPAGRVPAPMVDFGINLRVAI